MCEQFAQGHYVKRRGRDSNLRPTGCKSDALKCHYTTMPLYRSPKIRETSHFDLLIEAGEWGLMLQEAETLLLSICLMHSFHTKLFNCNYTFQNVHATSSLMTQLIRFVSVSAESPDCLSSMATGPINRALSYTV